METNSIEQLMDHGLFRGEPIGGTLIETHISWVILTREYAFKIKKPMQYSFLDFSTLANRKFYCERELWLNQRLTDIYLDVLPIRQQGGSMVIGKGAGKTIDYAVRMKKLQAAKKMDVRLRKNQVSRMHMDSLAKKIAHFHQHTTIIRTAFDPSRSKIDFNDIETIADWAGSHLGQSHTGQIRKAIAQSNAFLDRYGNLIRRRIEEGFQRDGHGDLHAKNIFLYRDPVIFDCIEFNDAFRQIDVLNEVAFFCMDLEAHERWDLSKHFMGSYLERMPCIRSAREVKLFTYYKAYRANIRAKVNAFRAMQAISARQLNKYANEVKKYLHLMTHYLQQCG